MKRVICILIVVAILFPCTLMGVSAEDVSADDFKTWTQGDPRWGDYVYGSTNTIRYSGCMITALAVLIAYSDPSKRDSEVFNPMILARNNLVFSNNILADWRVYNLEGGDNFLFVECIDTYSREDAAEVVRKNMLNGNYTMVYAVKDDVYSHFAPVVGWNSETDEPILWDVGSGLYGNDVCEPGCCWNTGFKKASGGMYRVLSYKSLLTSSLDTIYNKDFDPSKVENAEEIKEIGRSLAEEWELTGMPMKSDMVASQINIRAGDKLTWDSHLQENSVSIKNSIEHEKTPMDFIRVAFSFFGMLTIIYALFLFFGSILDNVNSFVDINFVSMLTLGKLRVCDEDVNSNLKKKGYVTKSGLYIRIFIILCVGVLFVSGVVSKLSYKIVGLIK